MDEAIAAEARRKSFKDIGASSSSLDSSGGIFVSKTGVYEKFNKNFKKKVSHDANQTKNESADHAKKGAQTQTQKQFSKEHTKTDSKDSGSKKGKVPKDTCRICFKKGHWAKEC